MRQTSERLLNFYGHSLRTSYPMSWFNRAAESDHSGDIVFQKGIVPETLANPLYRNPFLQCGPKGEVLYKSRQHGRFWVRGGEEIVFQPADVARQSSIESLLTSTLAALLFQQRGFLSLHASAIHWKGKTLLLCGTACSGKSTLAACCVRLGARLVADDLCLIEEESIDAIVPAGPPVVCLWKDAADFLEFALPLGESIVPGRHKFAFRIDDGPAGPPSMVVRLAPKPNSRGIEWSPLNGAEAVMPLDSVLWQQFTPNPHVSTMRALKTMDQLSRQIPFFRLAFPLRLQELMQVASRLLSQVEKLS